MSLLRISLDEFFATDWFVNSPDYVQNTVREYPPSVMYALTGFSETEDGERSPGRLMVQIMAYVESDDDTCDSCIVLALGVLEENDEAMFLAPCAPKMVRGVPFSAMTPIDERMSDQLAETLMSPVVQSFVHGNAKKNAQWN